MSDKLQPGDVYAGAFTVIRALGSGAFADVYEVSVPGHSRTRALKLSPPIIDDDASRKRAQREILLMRRLQSPHIPHCYESGIRPDGRMYLLMELLRGQALDQWFDFDAPLAPIQAVTLIHQACFGLAQAHSMGVVHRDIKPENIFIEESSRVRVLDFGLARSWDGSEILGSDASDTHLLAGTPHYCQPEQLITRQLTPAADVYSLGILLYELLSGHTPFHPDRPMPQVRDDFRDQPQAWFRAHRDLPVTPIRRHPGCEQLPQPLLGVIDRMLDKDPTGRPPNCGAVANIFGRLLNDTFGIPVAGELRIVHPDHSVEHRSLIPGHYSIGSGRRAGIALRDDALPDQAAILEWGGTPQLPQLRPGDAQGLVLVNGRPLSRTTTLRSGDELRIGRYHLTVRLGQPGPSVPPS